MVGRAGKGRLLRLVARSDPQLPALAFISVYCCLTPPPTCPSVCPSPAPPLTLPQPPQSPG